MKYLLLIMLLCFSCSRQYKVVEPISAKISEDITYYYITYTVEYDSGSFGTKELRVSKEVYENYIEGLKLK